MLLELPLDRSGGDAHCDVGFELRGLGGADLPAYLALRPDQREDEVRQRLSRGDACYAAWSDGRIVSAVWYQRGDAWIPEIGEALALPPGAVYACDSYTEPRVRGRNIAAARSARLHPMLRDEGAQRLLAYVLPENRAGMRAAHKLGYRRVGVMGRLRLGPVRLGFARFDGGRARWRLRRGAKAR